MKIKSIILFVVLFFCAPVSNLSAQGKISAKQDSVIAFILHKSLIKILGRLKENNANDIEVKNDKGQLIKTHKNEKFGQFDSLYIQNQKPDSLYSAILKALELIDCKSIKGRIEKIDSEYNSIPGRKILDPAFYAYYFDTLISRINAVYENKAQDALTDKVRQEIKDSVKMLFSKPLDISSKDKDSVDFYIDNIRDAATAKQAKEWIRKEKQQVEQRQSEASTWNFILKIVIVFLIIIIFRKKLLFIFKRRKSGKVEQNNDDYVSTSFSRPESQKTRDNDSYNIFYLGQPDAKDKPSFKAIFNTKVANALFECKISDTDPTKCQFEMIYDRMAIVGFTHKAIKDQVCIIKYVGGKSINGDTEFEIISSTPGTLNLKRNGTNTYWNVEIPAKVTLEILPSINVGTDAKSNTADNIPMHKNNDSEEPVIVTWNFDNPSQNSSSTYFFFGLPDGDTFYIDGMHNTHKEQVTFFEFKPVGERIAEYTMIDDESTLRVIKRISVDDLMPACILLNNLTGATQQINTRRPGKVEKTTEGWKIVQKAEISFS